jgi:hypothetical protein
MLLARSDNGLVCNAARNILAGFCLIRKLAYRCLDGESFFAEARFTDQVALIIPSFHHNMGMQQGKVLPAFMAGDSKIKVFDFDVFGLRRTFLGHGRLMNDLNKL